MWWNKYRIMQVSKQGYFVTRRSMLGIRMVHLEHMGEIPMFMLDAWDVKSLSYDSTTAGNLLEEIEDAKTY